jgi:hypothetical protein
LLAEWERSGERMSSWCAARGLNWYSLSAYKGWRERASAPAMLHLAEVVVRQAPQPATYRVLLGSAAIEVDDDFRADTLRRLVQVVASC